MNRRPTNHQPIWLPWWQRWWLLAPGWLRWTAILVAALCLLSLCGSVVWFVRMTFPADARDSRVVLYDLAEARSVRQAAVELEGLGLLRSRYYMAFRDPQGWASNRLIGPGEFAISKVMKPSQVFSALVNSRVFTRRVVVTPGDTLIGVAQKLRASGYARTDEFLELAQTQLLVSELHIKAPTAEGYLFPRDYDFSKFQEPAELLQSMVQCMRAEVRDILASCGNCLNEHELIVFASLIERVTHDPKLQPAVAGVLMKRAMYGMYLGSSQLHKVVKPAGVKVLPSGAEAIRRYLKITPRGSPSSTALQAAAAPKVDRRIGIRIGPKGELRFLFEPYKHAPTELKIKSRTSVGRGGTHTGSRQSRKGR